MSETIKHIWRLCRATRHQTTPRCGLTWLGEQFLILILTNIMPVTACAPKGIYFRTPEIKATVVNNDALVLSGNDFLEIKNSHYLQQNDIILRDNATLLIQNSFLEHRHEHFFQNYLRAYDNASVVIETSKIKSSPWLNWYFYDNSSLELRKVNNDQSSIWHIFHGSSWSRVNKVERFWATMNDSVSFDIADTNGTFIEFVYPARAKVDEAFPYRMATYSFPNDGEVGIKTKLTIKNSQAASWGITVNAESNVNIRNTHSLVVTLHVGEPYKNTTAEFSRLLAEHHKDETWAIGADTRLRLINTKTERWSPIVSGNNTLIVKNSDISDNAFSFGNARVVYDNCVIAFLHGNDQVHMMIKDSVVEGDVVATGNSVIKLINTRVEGKIVEKDSGRVIVTRKDSRKPW